MYALSEWFSQPRESEAALIISKIRSEAETYQIRNVISVRFGRKSSAFYLFTTPYYGYNLTLAKATTLPRHSGKWVHPALIHEHFPDGEPFQNSEGGEARWENGGITILGVSKKARERTGNVWAKSGRITQIVS